MIKLQWSDALATVARAYSMNCIWDHNDARGSELSSETGGAWTSCGENLATNSACPETWSSSKQCGGSWVFDDMGIKQAIEDGWSIEEAADYIWDDSGSRGSSAGGAIGHYTQVVWADTAYVGCGFSKCANGLVGSSNMKNVFTCNYYPAGNYNTQPYEPGSTGSNCPSDYPNVFNSDPYTDQDGEHYDLSGLCSADPGSNTGTGSSDPDPTEEPTAAPVDDIDSTTTTTPSPVDAPVDDPATDSGDCACFTISGATTNSAVDGTYTATDSTCSKYQSDSGIYLEQKCYSNGCFWGFYPSTSTSPQWNTYGYCYASDSSTAPASCTSWNNGANVVEGCDGTSDDDNDNDNNDDVTVSDGECIEISGWGTTGWGTFGGTSQWQLYSAEPEYNGYPVYKWTQGDWFMYVMNYHDKYTISPSIGAFQNLKGWCDQASTPITQCDGVWSNGAGVSFYECGGQPFIIDACLDDAAEYVRFLLDGDDESEYMQFALHEEVGCWGDSDEPVWMHLDEVANATYYLHRDADAWRITQHFIEGSIVYECFGGSHNIEDCTAGTWNEHYSLTNSTVGVVRGVRVLDTATVEVSASAVAAEEEEGLSPIDDVAIVLVVLLIVGVAGVVALLWCRRRNSNKGAVTFDAQDQVMGAAQTTHTVGDTVDVGTDEE